MELTGSQRKQVYEALLAAFPNQYSLERMVNFHLNEDLGTIAGDGPRADIVFTLILWAESQGRMKSLLAGALEENPGNRRLNDLVNELWLR